MFSEKELNAIFRPTNKPQNILRFVCVNHIHVKNPSQLL